MTDTVHKVTCFLTRTGKAGTELLLFIHPQVGVQIPVGMVNPGEELQVAARREAAEESGLNYLKLVRLLGETDSPPPQVVLLISHPAAVYSHTDEGSLDWAHFRSGLPVGVLRHATGFTR
jgi:ADP-ribose pyrophosphatase YjhB (NUDIX family)